MSTKRIAFQPSSATAMPKLTRQQFLAGLAAAAVAPQVFTIAAAQAAALGITEVAPGVFVHQGRHGVFNPDNGGDISNPSFIVGDEAVAVIDTGGSPRVGEALRAAIVGVTDRPIRYVINTHMHPDHVFGNVAFEADKPEFVAHHKMARGLAARADRYLSINKGLLGDAAFAGTKIILPTRAIDSVGTLDLGNRTLALNPRQTAHTDNDLTVLDTNTETLILGDLLFSGHIPTLDGSILGWLKLIDDMRNEKAQRVVPGHGPASMDWPGALDPLQRYLRRIADDVRSMIKANKMLDDAVKTAGRSEQDQWQLFDEFHVRNVTAAFAELEWE
ncbi:MAG: quinoprotein relay system zinc metallohydrolase 2 [Hyphomicrobium sp.]